MDQYRSVTRTKAYRCLPKDSAVRVYMRIMEAAAKGKGVVLSPEEVFSCSMDDAVEQAVISALEEFEED